MELDGFPERPLEFGLFDWVEWDPDVPIADTFEQRLRLMEYADEAGFYGYHLAEHQGTPLSLNTSPSVLLGAAAQRTHRLRLGALVFALPWYEPLRLYNEICVVDQLSHGRLELGIGRGVSPIEAAYLHITSADQSREMSQEALEVLLAAFASEQLDHHGKYYDYTGVGLWNKPYQKPYPPMWYPSSNADSVPFIAKHGFHTSHNFAPNAVAKLHFERYRSEWVAHRYDEVRLNGHVAAPLLANTRHVYVAETDQQAFKEASEPFQRWSEHISFLSGQFSSRPVDHLSLQTRMASGTALVGSPDTVASQIRAMVAETGINYVLGVFAFGNLSAELSLRSLNLFAERVIPQVKAARAVS